MSQATKFETTICECQLVLNFSVPEEIIYQRLVKRAEAENRADDKEDVIRKRIEEYNSKTMLPLEYYNKLGKVKEVRSIGTPLEDYQQVLKAILPQLYFIIGSKSSGKTAVSKYLADRTNMKYINFQQFASQKSFIPFRNNPVLITQELIKHLHTEYSTRIVIDGFPEVAQQLQYFLSNAVEPDKVIFIKAHESRCLKLNEELGSKNSEYVTPAILYKLLKEFYPIGKEIENLCIKKKVPFLAVENKEGMALKELQAIVAGHVNPEILLVRSNENSREEGSEELLQGMMMEMKTNHQYKILDVPPMRKEEISRLTAIGEEMIQYTSKGKIIPAECTIKLLKKVIYSVAKHNKFILKGFPEEVDQLVLFEQMCGKIKREYYFYGKDQLKFNNPSTATIETYMQREGRLTPLNDFDYEKINQYEGTQLQYVLILGFEQSGKTTSAKRISGCGYKLLTLGDIKTVLQNRGKTEEVPAENVNVTFDQMVAELKKQTVERENKKEKFVFDDLPMDKMDDMKKIISAIGPPAYLIELVCNPEEIKKRIQKNVKEQNSLRKTKKKLIRELRLLPH